MITSLYAGLLCFVYLFLMFLVIRGRWKYRISLGDGGNAVMNARIRAQANFVETVPLALLLIFILDYQHVAPLYLHIFGCMLLAGRILHPYGLIKGKNNAGKARMAGMILTLLCILFAGITCLCKALSGFLFPV